MVTLLILLIVVDVVLLAWFSEKDEPHPIGSILVILASVAIYHFLIKPFNYQEVLTWGQANVTNILLGATAWVVLGVIWSFIKWYFYLGESKSIQDENYQKQVDDTKKRGGTLLTELKYEIPTAIRNKERIITWMLYWPFSIIATMLSNWAYRLFRGIFNSISGAFDKMAQSRFK